MSFHCECGLRLANPVYPVYCRCGRVHDPDGTSKTPAEQPPAAWVALVRRLRKPEDRGVGDTVQRLASWLGGEQFKKLSQKLGIPCGCTQRQAEWNERWRY